MRIYQSGDCSGTVEAQGSAAQFASPGLTATVDNDSTSTFTATASDAGNTSGCSAAFTYTEDSTAPETTIDSGPSGDTNDNTPTFTFSSSEPNSSFQCRFDADPFAACSGPGDSHTASLPDGPHSFEVRATDQAQNTDQTPDSRAFTIDSAAPDAPSIEDSDPDSPANENNPELKGDAEAGSTVRIYQSGDCSGTVEAQGSAAQFASPGLTATVDNDSTSTFTATASDAGNTSGCSAAFTYTEDSTGPAAPTVTTTAPPSPANDNNPEVKGTVAGGSPTQVKLYKNATCAGVPDATGTVTAFTGAGITVNVPDNSTTALSARTADQAGNDSSCSNTINYVEDSNGPAAPSINDSDPDSPANDNNPELKGSAATGSTVRIYKAPTAADCTPANLAAIGSEDDFSAAGLTANVAADSTTTFRATATDAAGNTSGCSAAFTYTEDSTAPETTIDSGPSGDTNDNTPTFTFSSSEPNSSFQCRFDADPFAACSGPGDSHTASLPDGPHSFEVRATDQAQNTDQTPDSRAFTIDSAAPDAPSIEDSDPDSPANENNPELKGDAEAGSTVRIYQSGDCSGTVEAQGSAAQFASPGLTATVDNDSTSTFTATASDAGNTSGCSAAFTYTEDSTGPAAPTVTTTAPPSPANDNNPEVKGTVAGGSPTQVKLYKNATCAGVPDATGTVTAFTGAGITVNVPDNSTTALSARTADQAGNDSSCSNTINYVEDSNGPAAPSINDSDPDSPANDNNPELKGSAAAGSTVRLYESGNCTGPIEAQGSAAQFASPGLTATVANNSNNAFTATATDTAGNASTCSAAFNYTEDSTGPAAPTVTTTAPPSPANDNNPEVKGTVAGGSPTQVKLYKNATCAGVPDATGTVTAFTGAGITVNVPDNSTTALSARTADQAGNDSSCSNTINYVESSNGPAAPVINDSDPNSPANDNNPELKGSAAAGSTVRLYQSGNCTGPIEAQGSAGQFASPGLTATVTNNSNNSFTATATNAAGNASTCSAAFNYVEDSIGPVPPTITDSYPDSPANDNNPELTGSAAAGSTVRLYQSGNCTGPIEAQGSAGQFAFFGLTATVANNSNNAFTATATDAAGNASTCSAAFNYREDSTPPQTTITSGPSGNTRDRTPTFRFTSSEPSGDTFQCRVDGASFSACSSPKTLSTLSFGNHTFRVRAIDQAGNIDPEPAKRTFTVVR